MPMTMVNLRLIFVPVAIDYREHSTGIEWKGLYLFGLRVACWSVNT